MRIYHRMTLGEVLEVEPDAHAVEYDIHAVKFISNKEEHHTVGHIPKYLSELCFEFFEDGGDLEAEVIGKIFNGGKGTGVEVPVDLKFV